MSKKSKSDSGTKQIWFPAKAHGYGRGLPVTWQGWVTLLGCLSVGIAPLFYLSIIYNGDSYCNNLLAKGIAVTCNPNNETGMYLLAAIFWFVASVLLLVHISTLKGAPTKWQWSSKAKHEAKS